MRQHKTGGKIRKEKDMAELLQYKCPNCGATIAFDSTEQKMLCSSCGTEIDPAALKEYSALLKENSTKEERTEWGTASGVKWEGKEAENISASVCQSCGGELLMEHSTVALECPYCGNATIVPERVDDILRPDMIIPFKVNKNGAKEALRNFYKGKHLLPKFFKQENRIDKITGIYVPFWLYDCDTSANMVYDATRVSSWRSGDMRYTKTDHFMLTRGGNIRFEKIPADGSKKMDDALMESIEPFHYEDLEDFAMPYLSGYLADKYDVAAEENRSRINERIRHSVESSLQSTTEGYHSCHTRSQHIDIKNGEVHYTLFPVWILNTKWRKETYSFAMNGQTGKIVGDLPISWKKGALIGVLVFLAAAALLIAGVFLLQPASSILRIVQMASLVGIVLVGLSYLLLRKKDGRG
jgi:predicted RNA-binding Zn-ribbon protein involved in translation (DUF1610 family)